MNDSLCVCIVDDQTNDALPLVIALQRLGVDSFLFSNAEELLGSNTMERAGCIVLDIELPGISGLELQSELRLRDCLSPVIVVSGRATVRDTIRAFEFGARAFYEKPFNIDDLLKTVSDAIVSDERRRQREAESRRRLAALSQREREVVELLVAGMSVKSIGRQLGISSSTAEKHRANVLQKTGFESVIDLTRFVFTCAVPAQTMENFASRHFDSPAPVPNPTHLPIIRRRPARV